MRTTLSAAWLGALVLAVPAAAQVDNGWFPAESFLSGKVPRSGVVADVDLDGHLDVVTGNVTSYDLTVLRGKGDGRLSPPKSITVGKGIQQVASGDVDGDGLPDLIALLGTPASAHPALALSQGLAGGGFDEAQLQSLPTDTSDALPRALATGDMDGDGRLDAVVLGSGSGPNAVLLRGSPTGFGAPEDIGLGNQPRVVELADVDGDGLLDVLSGHALASAGRLFVSLGDGAGHFSLHEAKGLGAEPVALTSVDLDVDGQLDVLVGFSGPNEFHGVGVLRGVGGGLLEHAPGLDLPYAPTELFSAALDGDAWPDLCVGMDLSLGQRQLLVLRGDGLGALVGIDEFQVPALALLGLGDVDEDGQLDLVSTQLQSGRSFASVRHGLPDGRFDVSRNGVSLAGVGSPLRLCASDVTGDGLRDLVAVSQSKNLAMYPGTGTGDFAAPVVTMLAAVAFGFELADLDVDGLPDVLLAGPGSGPAISVCAGFGVAGFGEPVSYDAPELTAATSRVAVGDLNGDGWTDVLSATPAFNGTRFGVWPGDGSLVPGAPILTDVVGASLQVRLADMDADGDLDLLRLDTMPHKLISLPGHGDGSFGNQAVHTLGPGLGTASFDVGDIDEDGVLDVGVAMPTAELRLLFGSGDGGFDPSKAIVQALPFAASDLELIDLDLDSHVDILLGAADPVLVYPGRGAASFKPARFYQGGGHHGARAAADLDGDLYPDVLLSGSGVGVFVMPGRSSPWTDLGHALASSLGTPSLFGAGPAEPGTSYVQGWQGPPGAVALMIIGSSIAELPFQGGVLVPSPDLVIPVPPVLSIDATWDDALPAGLLVALQVWFQAGGETSASNALAVVLES